MSKNTHPQLQLIKPDPNLSIVSVKGRKTPRKQPQSFPMLNPEKDGQGKINNIRNQTSLAKNQVLLLKARINKLKGQKVSNEKKLHQSIDVAARFNLTRERFMEKQKIRSIITERRELQTSKNKERANKFRVELKRDLEKAKKKIQLERTERAKEERLIRKQDEEYIAESKQLDKQENHQKALVVKKYEEEHSQRMHMFYETSRVRSHYNHISRVQNCLREKSQVNKILKQLYEEEERLRREAEQSQSFLIEAEEKLREMHGNSRVTKMSRSGVRTQKERH